MRLFLGGLEQKGAHLRHREGVRHGQIPPALLKVIVLDPGGETDDDHYDAPARQKKPPPTSRRAASQVSRLGVIRMINVLLKMGLTRPQRDH